MGTGRTRQEIREERKVNHDHSITLPLCFLLLAAVCSLVKKFTFHYIVFINIATEYLNPTRYHSLHLNTLHIAMQSGVRSSLQAELSERQGLIEAGCKSNTKLEKSPFENMMQNKNRHRKQQHNN